MGDCALITPVYLEIALLSGARSGAQATGQVISAIDIADISIHALREEGDLQPAHADPGGQRISIHALREEGDRCLRRCCSCRSNFYPRPLRGGRRTPLATVTTGGDFYPHPPRGGRLQCHSSYVVTDPFLSTPSVRRATLFGLLSSREFDYFYPRPPRGGRPRKPCTMPMFRSISIHTLREEGDQVTGFQFFFFIRFLSTPSVRRATRNVIRRATAMLFLSTPSVRRATDDALFDAPCFPISIHALHEEGDSKNREKILCFCLIIHLPAQIAKRSL